MIENNFTTVKQKVSLLVFEDFWKLISSDKVPTSEGHGEDVWAVKTCGNLTWSCGPVKGCGNFYKGKQNSCCMLRVDLFPIVNCYFTKAIQFHLVTLAKSEQGSYIHHYLWETLTLPLVCLLAIISYTLFLAFPVLKNTKSKAALESHPWNFSIDYSLPQIYLQFGGANSMFFLFQWCR